MFVELEGRSGHYRYALVVQGPGIGRVDVPIIVGDGGGPEEFTVTFVLYEFGGLVSNRVIVTVRTV